MAKICNACGGSVPRTGDKSVCEDCGALVDTPKAVASGRTGRSRAPGWIGDAIPRMATGVSELARDHDWVDGDMIQTWLVEHERSFLDSLVRAGSFAHVDAAAVNVRGWFNRAWTEGWNPHSHQFHRTEKPFRFKMLDEGP